MREMRRFIVDTLSYHPALKLEWIALGEDGRAQRIIRRESTASSSTPASAKKKMGKDKWKAPPSDANGNLNNGSGANGFPVFPPHGWGPDSSSDDEEDEEGGDGDGPGTVKLSLSENTPFYDIGGVQVFQKEIVDGRL